MKSNVYKYIDYIPGLSKEEKEWYQVFIRAYYYQDSKSMNKINMPVEMRRALYRNHRAVKNDPFNKNLVDYWHNSDDKLTE